LYSIAAGSVAEPESVERKLFAEAGADVFLAWLRRRVCKMLKYSKFFILNFEVDFKNHNLVATGIYFKEPFDYQTCLYKT
jgi:hypothetical protein